MNYTIYMLKLYVSIPNGMEFYKIGSFIPLLVNCFNSQRDGILPRTHSIASSTFMFQFPTGWNSTVRHFVLIIAPVVSIPNGMEFYRNDKTLSQSHRKVSIPNGMEFYSLTPSNLDKPLLFQFPTGWNSTLLRRQI